MLSKGVNVLLGQPVEIIFNSQFLSYNRHLSLDKVQTIILFLMYRAGCSIYQ